MSRARRIADAILSSERLASSRAFSERVYGDEPILRTGTEALDDLRRSAAERVRRERAPMPQAYRRLRALERGRSGWGYGYDGGGSRLFYEQGQLIADLQDDFEGTSDVHIYYPTYYQMSDHDLRCYVGWRTRLRSGQVTPAPTSFLFMHAYELLCGIGCEPGEAGFDELTRFAEQYAGTSDSFDVHLARWRHDYVIYHGLDASQAPTMRDSLFLGSVRVLRRAEEGLLAQPDPGAWPERVPEGMPQPEELLDALASLSRYRAERSRLFRERRQDVAHVTCRVFARMVDHCHRRRKTDLVDGLFGVPTRVSYTMFSSAVFWSPDRHEDVTYDLGPSERYACERGFWWRELPCRRTETSKELGALLHAIDARMRVALGDSRPLKERPLPKYQARFVDAEIQALMDLRAAQEAARVRIDRSALGHIRSAAARTREALLTDDEREEDVASSAGVADVPEAPPAMTALQGLTDSSSSDGGGERVVDSELGLSDDQLDVLRALLDGRSPEGDSLAVSLATDAINEAFLDVLGDTVIEFDGEAPVLVEDYEQEVRAVIGA